MTNLCCALRTNGRPSTVMEFRLDMSDLFIAVRDTNRKRIRGLWKRGEKHYLQVRAPGASARTPLLKGTTPVDK